MGTIKLNFNRKVREENRMAALFLGPAILILAALSVFPMLYLVYLSFFSWNLGSPFSSREFIGLDNFLKMIHDKQFLNAFVHTLIYTLCVLFIELVLGLLLALVLVKLKQGAANRFIRSTILLPMMTTPVVAGLIWKLLYNNDMGMINYVLRMFGMHGLLWLSDTKLAMVSVMIVDIWQWTPFMFLILYAGISALPHEPFEAGEVDGASSWQKFFHITLPLLQPTLLVALLIRGMDAMKIFDQVYTLTFGGPGDSSEVLSLYIYRQGFIMSNVGYSSALSIVLAFVITLFGSMLIRMMAAKSS